MRRRILNILYYVLVVYFTYTSLASFAFFFFLHRHRTDVLTVGIVCFILLVLLVALKQLAVKKHPTSNSKSGDTA